VTRPDVLIIGGGVIGASTAYHLAARECRNVVVIDAGIDPGAGSTSKATGGFRCQFATEVNIRLSLLSRQKLLRFEAEIGADPGYRQHGYLFLAREARELEALRSALALQHRCGVSESREVPPDVVRVLNPALTGEGIIGATFCPTDGFIRPMSILRGYTEAARRLGVRFDYGVPCTGITVDPASGLVTKAETGEGAIAPGAVVNAAGAWAGAVARLAGVEIPVTPLRRQVAVVLEQNLLPESMPMTIFAGDGFHLRVRDGRVLLLMPTDEPHYHSTELGVEEAWVARVHALARSRVTPLARCVIDKAHSWSGLYEMSPDKHVLLGKAPGVNNLYLVNGSSGHGVMHAPALGDLAAELILGGAANEMDIRPLRPSRFAEGQPNNVAEFL
jgi:sarcosine oxidase subunit beta